jgi:hypothetical protein
MADGVVIGGSRSVKTCCQGRMKSNHLEVGVGVGTGFPEAGSVKAASAATLASPTLMSAASFVILPFLEGDSTVMVR